MDNVANLTPEQIQEEQRRIAKDLNMSFEQYQVMYQTGSLGQFGAPIPNLSRGRRKERPTKHRIEL